MVWCWWVSSGGSYPPPFSTRETRVQARYSGVLAPLHPGRVIMTPKRPTDGFRSRMISCPEKRYFLMCGLSLTRHRQTLHELFTSIAPWRCERTIACMRFADKVIWLMPALDRRRQNAYKSARRGRAPVQLGRIRRRRRGRGAAHPVASENSRTVRFIERARSAQHNAYQEELSYRFMTRAMSASTMSEVRLAPAAGHPRWRLNSTIAGLDPPVNPMSSKSECR